VYCWHLFIVRDEVSPKFDRDRDIFTFAYKRVKTESREVWLRVNLGSTPDSPETEKLRAICEAGSEVKWKGAF
jgi:hypothetical protein